VTHVNAALGFDRKLFDGVDGQQGGAIDACAPWLTALVANQGSLLSTPSIWKSMVLVRPPLRVPDMLAELA
jgi:hypothetical protein